MGSHEEALDLIEEDEKQLSASARKALAESRKQLKKAPGLALNAVRREFGL